MRPCTVRESFILSMLLNLLPTEIFTKYNVSLLWSTKVSQKTIQRENSSYRRLSKKKPGLLNGQISTEGPWSQAVQVDFRSFLFPCCLSAAFWSRLLQYMLRWKGRALGLCNAKHGDVEHEQELLIALHSDGPDLPLKTSPLLLCKCTSDPLPLI